MRKHPVVGQSYNTGPRYRNERAHLQLHVNSAPPQELQMPQSFQLQGGFVLLPLSEALPLNLRWGLCSRPLYRLALPCSPTPRLNPQT